MTMPNNSQTEPKKCRVDPKFHILPVDTPVASLDCKAAVSALSDEERLYAHYLARASFEGSVICLHQTSPESPAIFVLLLRLFGGQSFSSLKELALNECGFSKEEFSALVMYTVGFFCNYGNYKSFGDTKFIPDLSHAQLLKLIKASAFYKTHTAATELLTAIGDRIYTLTEKEVILGLKDEGVTCYHSSNVTKADTELIDRFMKANNMEAWNTRLFKVVSGDKTEFEIRLASIESGEVSPPKSFENVMVKVTRGDYSEHLKKVNENLVQAKKHAANDFQRAMLGHYIEHFRTGELNKHKDGSREWIKDKGPAVESYIGFIENYRDPAGVRSEFEGFAASVNAAMSAKFARLVADAERLLTRLPWGDAYEKDVFLRPDFTSLDLIAFGTGGIPAGINIPNCECTPSSTRPCRPSLRVSSPTPNVC